MSDQSEEGELRQDAGRGGPRYSRRRFLILGAALVAGVAGAVELGRRIAGGGASGGLAGIFGPFPVRSVEDVPHVPALRWVLTVDGLVDAPLTIDHGTWSTLQRLDETADFHCVEGWTVDDVRWAGVAPALLLDRAGVRPEGTHVVFHARGGEYVDSLPLELVTHPETVLADTLNDELLPAEHGGPLRLVVPVQLGYKSVKWVERMEVTDRPVQGYWEQRGYPADAPVTS